VRVGPRNSSLAALPPLTTRPQLAIAGRPS